MRRRKSSTGSLPPTARSCSPSSPSTTRRSAVRDATRAGGRGAPHLGGSCPFEVSRGGSLGRRSRRGADRPPTPARRRVRPGTPYGRVVEGGGQVVLLGPTLDTVTLVHHADAIARVEGKRRVAWRCPALVDGGREWRTLHDI